MSGIHLGTAAIGVLAIIAAFGLGIQSADKIDTFERSEAAPNTASVTQKIPGDIDENGVLNVADPLKTLEFAQGLAKPTREQILNGDMDGDYALTARDVMSQLRILNNR